MTTRLNLLLLGALASAALAPGCNTVPAVEVPKEVRTKVPVPCIAPADVPPRPAVRTAADLMAMDTYRRTLAAWSDLRRLEAHAAQLEALVEGCSRLPRAPP